MTGTYELRFARKPYECSEHSYHKIALGDLHLYASIPPWHEFSRDKKKWQSMRTCLRCAERYGMHNSETRKQLEQRTEVTP